MGGNKEADTFIPAGGGIDLGEIDALTALACRSAVPAVLAGPIRLQAGIAGKKGYGNLHVESYPGRMDQIGGLGFPTFAGFALEVARNYVQIERCEEPNRLRLVARSGAYDYVIVVQLNEAGFWSVTTGFPRATQNKDAIHAILRPAPPKPANAGVKRARPVLSLKKAKPANEAG